MNRPVALIGGSGFIGQAIADSLAKAGHRVLNFDVVPPPRPSPAEFHYFDLTDVANGDDMISQCEAVVFAAGALAKTCRERPDCSWKLNVEATLRWMNRLVALPMPPRIIFLSSGMVYDQTQPVPFAESATTKQSCLYTASKLAAENCLAAAAHAKPIHALILRPFTVFGKYGIAGDRGHLFGRWLELGASGRPLTVFGDGSQVVDPVAVELVGEACAAYLASKPSRRLLTVNVTSGRYVTVLQLANLFVEAGLAPSVVFEGALDAVDRRGWGDPSALEELLGRSVHADPQFAVRDFLSQLATK